MIAVLSEARSLLARMDSHGEPLIEADIPRLVGCLRALLRAWDDAQVDAAGAVADGNPWTPPMPLCWVGYPIGCDRRARHGGLHSWELVARVAELDG